MSKRSLKRPNDPIQLAKLIGDIATGQASEPVVSDKDREAAEAGRLGGMKGGVKRAEALTPERRQAIARKAAATRWAQKPKP